jgi:cytochrome c oxidase subunit 3
MSQPTTLQPAAASATLDAPRTGNWDGGNEPFKASYGKLMMWFFLLSDAFTFAAFLTTSGMIRQRFRLQHALVAHPGPCV